jgi:hypothetical protein
MALILSQANRKDLGGACKHLVYCTHCDCTCTVDWHGSSKRAHHLPGLGRRKRVPIVGMCLSDTHVGNADHFWCHLKWHGTGHDYSTGGHVRLHSLRNIASELDIFLRSSRVAYTTAHPKLCFTAVQSVQSVLIVAVLSTTSFLPTTHFNLLMSTEGHPYHFLVAERRGHRGRKWYNGRAADSTAQHSTSGRPPAEGP